MQKGREYGLRILPAAVNDVDELAAFIAKNSIEQAIRFYDAVAITTTRHWIIPTAGLGTDSNARR
jgi:plasmid stabilization system protein ParE